MDLKKALVLIPLITFFTITGLKAQTRKHKLIKKTNSAALKTAIDAGSKVFMEYCVTCHQSDGMGIPDMNPPLAKTTYVTGDKTKLIKIVLNGFNDDVDINGQRYSNTMASHDFLQDKEIADVLTYVRNSFGNKASAIGMAQVKAVRAANKK